MQDADVAWAQNLVNRWATKQAVPAPTVITVPSGKEITILVMALMY